MSVTCKADKRDFQSSLNRLLGTIPKEMHGTINMVAKEVVLRARKNTPLASRQAIETIYGATLQSQRTQANGKIRRRYKYAPTKLVYLLLNSKQKKAGKRPIPKADMAAAAKKFVANKLRAIGSLRNGWKRALGILASAAGSGAVTDGPNVRANSTAVPAKPGWSPQAEATYRMVIQGGQIDPRVGDAADKAFDETKGLMDALVKKLQAAARKAGTIP